MRDKKIHLPDLQRGFVWAAQRVQALHDSLYRRYPVGALLLWKPTWLGDEAPFATRKWEIFPPDPTTERGRLREIPLMQPGSFFVLDGQQRLTSLFRVIFQSRIKDKTSPDPDLLVALSPSEEWVKDPFHLRSRSLHRKMRDGLIVPAEILFEGIRGGDESRAIQSALGEWVTATDDLFLKALDRANAIRTSILQAEIIAYEIDADAEDENVIEIFARLNQQGARLRPSDLAAARLTGRMANFRDRAHAVLRSQELTGFGAPEGKEEGMRGGGYVDTDLLIRAAVFLGSGLVRYRDVEKREARGGTYGKVEAHWDVGAQGFKAAVTLFRQEGIPQGTWLPYRYLLLPPAIAAAKGHPLRSNWLAWAILASLWRHYGGEVDNKLQKDCNLAEKAEISNLIDHVKTRAKRIESAIPTEEDFTENIVSEGGVLLALIVHFKRNEARSFPGGKLLSGAEEPLEVHHIFPRAVINSYKERTNEFVSDRLGNLTLLTRSDNEHLGDTPPSEYLPSIKSQERITHLIPDDQNHWGIEKYLEFCQEREHQMARTIRKLLQNLNDRA